MRAILLWAIIIAIFICFAIVGSIRSVKGEETRDWTGIVIHHSATERGSVDSIRKYHIEVNGWDDIGYHFIIAQSGEIFDGRPLSKIGAHALGRNSTHIGVCLIGQKSFTGIQKANLRGLCRVLAEQYDIKSIEPHHEQCPGEGLGYVYFLP